jgi:hypothetical protein
MAIAFQPLTVTPVNFSLTAGTTIPAPPDSPPQTPVKSTSLPSIQEDGSDADAKKTAVAVAAPPLSPLSANGTSPARKFNGVRKFLSLRSLRGPDGTVHGRPVPAKLQLRAAHSSGKLSYDASRPGTPPLTALSADAGAAAAAAAVAPSSSGGGSSGALKHKRSAGWFGTGGGAKSRRRSALFFLGGGNHMDERVERGETVQEITERKIRTGPPAPSIPELKGLASTTASQEAASGDSWDVDGMFKDIK